MLTHIYLPHYQPKPLSPNNITKASWHNHFSSNRKNASKPPQHHSGNIC